MSSRRLYLMRHADVAYFDPDGKPMRPREVRLTPRGIEQARAAAEALVGIRFERVVTSGLPRTPGAGGSLRRRVHVAPYDLAHTGGRETALERLYSQYRP